LEQDIVQIKGRRFMEGIWLMLAIQEEKGSLRRGYGRFWQHKKRKGRCCNAGSIRRERKFREGYVAIMGGERSTGRMMI
jgi:hypothetical protein